jgi:hypothetical protein
VGLGVVECGGRMQQGCNDARPYRRELGW